MARHPTPVRLQEIDQSGPRQKYRWFAVHAIDRPYSRMHCRNLTSTFINLAQQKQANNKKH